MAYRIKITYTSPCDYFTIHWQVPILVHKFISNQVVYLKCNSNLRARTVSTMLQYKNISVVEVCYLLMLSTAKIR